MDLYTWLIATDSTLTLSQVQDKPRRGAVISSDAASEEAPIQPTLEDLCAAARRDVLARLGLLSQSESQQPPMPTLRRQVPALEPAERLDASFKAVAKLDGVLSVLPYQEGRSLLPQATAQQRHGEVDNPPPVEELCAAARRDVLARLGFVGRVPPPPPSNAQPQLSSSDRMEWSGGGSLASNQ
jgi:hypothetical protein